MITFENNDCRVFVADGTKELFTAKNVSVPQPKVNEAFEIKTHHIPSLHVTNAIKSLRDNAACVAFDRFYNQLTCKPAIRNEGVIEVQVRLYCARICLRPSLLAKLRCDTGDIESMMVDIITKEYIPDNDPFIFYVTDKTRAFFREFEQSKLGHSLKEPHFSPEFGIPMICCTKRYAWMFIRYASLVILKDALCLHWRS